MTNNNWHVPLSKFSDEQRKVIESLLGDSCGRTYLCKGKGQLRLSDSLSELNEITPNEAFKTLGLDRLLEPEQGLQGVDWSLVEPEYKWLAQRKSDCDVDFFEVYPNQSFYTILATRPKPKVKPLTDEQIEAVKQCLSDISGCDVKTDDWKGYNMAMDSIRSWLKGRKQTGGEL